MAGRVAVLDLPFLALAERCHRGTTQGTWVEDLFAANPLAKLRGCDRLPQRAIEPTLASRLWRGGFPGHLDHDDEILPDLFFSYLRTYVERDVRRVAAVEDADLFARLVGLCADTGLAAWTQRISSPTALLSNPIQGALFETHVVLDLLKQAQTMRHPPRAHHWRVHSGTEVDLVLERDGMLIAIIIAVPYDIA